MLLVRMHYAVDCHPDTVDCSSNSIVCNPDTVLLKLITSDCDA